jgi:putative ABC transport system substrate-binding protein
LNVSTKEDIDTAFDKVVQQRVAAVVAGSDAFITTRSEQLAALATRHRIPAVMEVREFAAAGGLMSYGTGHMDGHRQVGVYTGRILKGERAADLPVVQSTKVELVINLNAAKLLGLTFPITLLGRADEAIE